MLCSDVIEASADQVDPTRAGLLRARYVEMQEQLHRSAFQRPIELSSTETSAEATADVYALVDFPFSSVSDALSQPKDWCDILIPPERQVLPRVHGCCREPPRRRDRQ